MWAALILVVLTCGYLYSSKYLPSKLKQQKAIGWNAYFDVAAQGGYFLLSGVTLTCAIWIALWALMSLLNILYFLDFLDEKLTFAWDILDLRIFGFKALSASAIGLTVLITIGAIANIEKKLSDPLKTSQMFKEIARSSSTESLLLESIERGMFLLITLKSRKVYVGMVDMARFDHLDTDTVVIIPFMSGYRHKDTLTFIVEHNYASYYQEEGITLTSEPLSVYQFRHVLPFDQIESLSLFSVDTFLKFNKRSTQDKAFEV